MDARSALPGDAVAFVRDALGEDWSVRPLTGDASVRAYFRIARPDGTTYVLAWYPEEVRPQLQRFLDAWLAVSDHARIPDLLGYTESAALQQDVGDRTLLDVITNDRREGLRLYRAAIDLLAAFQSAPARAINPPFTAEFFAAELQMTRTYYVEQLMGVPAERSAGLEPLFAALCAGVARHPYVLCHRDYHGENLQLHEGMLYLLDYQDLRMGPDTYDLASLLRDRGVARLLGEETEEELIAYYRTVTGADAGVRRRYFETLLQRSIKILGTFARQPIERGKLHYLDYIPPTLESIRRCLGELPEYAPLGRLLPLEFDLDSARAQLERTH